MNDSNFSVEMLRQLNLQIEIICQHLKEMHKEAAGIAHASGMPDAALHLNDVLQATEEATNSILDSATAIGALAENEGVSSEHRQQLVAHVGRIYEACTFQDVSGQRIKKVLRHLSTLEAQLMRLSDTAKGNVVPVEQADPLLNGPQLSADTPSQADIDKLFG